MLIELKNSHQKEKEIIDSCREFQTNMNDNQSKIKAVMIQAQEDSQRVTQLKKDLDQAQQILMILREKDEQSAKKIENLQQVQKHLEENIKNDQEKNKEKIKEYQKVCQEKSNYEKQNTSLVESNVKYQNQLNTLQDQIQNTQQRKLQLQTEERFFHQNIQETQIQIDKNEERIHETYLEYVNAQEKKDDVLKQLEEEKKQFKIYEKNMETIFSSVKLVLDQIKDLKKQNLLLEECEIKNSEILNNVQAKNNQFINDRYDLEKSILDLQKEVNLKKLEHKQRQIIKNSLNLKFNKLNEEENIVNQETLRNQQIFDNYFVQLKILREETKPVKNSLSKLNTKHEELKKHYKSLCKNNDDLIRKIKKILQTNQNTVQHIYPCQAEINLKSREIKIEKQEKEKVIKDINILHCQIQAIKQDLLLKDNIISEIQKKSLETEQILMNLQQQYEQVRIERNGFSKQLKDSKGQISEIERKINITQNFMDQMQEELQIKCKQSILKNQDAENLNKSYQILLKKNTKLKIISKQKIENLKHIQNNINKYKAIQQELENQIKATIKHSENIVIERDSIITNLIEINEQLENYQETHAKQTETMQQGEIQYKKKEAELHYLNILQRDLIQEIQINQIKTNKIVKYRQKIEKIDESLKQEKLKVKALSEELENPINVNRWRTVGQQQDDVFELVSDIQNAQKKLIKKTEEIIQEDLKINSQKKTIQNFQEIYQKNPGIEEAEKLLYCQRVLKKKIRKLKACAAELNLFKFKINQEKENKEGIRENIEEHKKKLFSIMIRQKKFRQNQKRINHLPMIK